MVRIRSSTWFNVHGGFPLSIHRVPEQREMEAHGHEFEELVITLAGHGVHETATERYEISAGDVFVIRRGQRHRYGFSPDLSIINVLYDPERLRLHWAGLRDLPGYHSLFQIEPRLRRTAGFSSRLRLTDDQLAKAVELVAQIEDEMDLTQGGYRFLAAAYFMELVCYLSRCYSEMETPETRPVMRLGDTLSFIEAHYNEHITVAQLARIAHMSETTLIRSFKQVLDRSPMEHVIRTRISKAKELLAGTDLTITEICFDCGFNDSNYFSRQFRKVTGMSPREFRRNP